MAKNTSALAQSYQLQYLREQSERESEACPDSEVTMMLSGTVFEQMVARAEKSKAWKRFLWMSEPTFHRVCREQGVYTGTYLARCEHARNSPHAFLGRINGIKIILFK